MSHDPSAGFRRTRFPRDIAKLCALCQARARSAAASTIKRGRNVAGGCGKWHNRFGRRRYESWRRQAGDDRADFDGVRAERADPMRRTAAAIRLAGLADAMHDAGAALYRRLVGRASGRPRRALAMRLSRPGRPEDLIDAMRLTEVLLAAALAAAASAGAADAQDAMRGLDMASPDMTTAEMTRADVQAALAAAPEGHGADFTGKRLSGLDLSGLD